MHGHSRREFLQMGASLAAALGLGQKQAIALADGLERLAEQKTRVLWLQGMSCSGCSVSFLNTDTPDPVEVLTEMISLVFHQTISATQGTQAMETLSKAVDEGNYCLVVEGAIPLTMQNACTIGGKPLATLLPPILRNAQAVVAAGTCAAFGGIPAAEGNATGAASVKECMEKAGIPVAKRLINCPGCPVHPQTLVATLAYVANKRFPDVDPVLLTPTAFYRHSVHDECPRFHYWEKHEFAEKFGDEGCLFKLGCLGPLSHTNCPRRQWNSGVNWCIRAGAPCIGCTNEQFAKKKDFPFYRKGEQYHAVEYQEQDRKGPKDET
ncbi:MAG: hydrogenase small subunit [Phycisphaerae bacterium]|nr:hydrogenase small subunit [Phycisphaerae bacterium]